MKWALEEYSRKLVEIEWECCEFDSDDHDEHKYIAGHIGNCNITKSGLDLYEKCLSSGSLGGLGLAKAAIFLTDRFEKK